MFVVKKQESKMQQNDGITPTIELATPVLGYSLSQY